jgi:membrane protein implicated in regulation of membrane protease activity
MTHSDWFLFCFAFGFVWSMAAVALGSFHFHSHVPHVHHGAGIARGAGKISFGPKFIHDVLNIHSIAIFLAWFGGCGYLMSRHSEWGLAIVVLCSLLCGFVAAFVLALFLGFLHRRERVLDAFDFEMVGVLGRVSSTIRPGGTGEILFTREDSRHSACARSEDNQPVERDVEVIVTRYEKGVAYVRTWNAMTDWEAGLIPQRDGGSGEAPPVPG